MLFTTILAITALGFAGGGLIWIGRGLRSMDKNTPIPKLMYVLGAGLICLSVVQMNNVRIDANESGANSVYANYVENKKP